MKVSMILFVIQRKWRKERGNRGAGCLGVKSVRKVLPTWTQTSAGIRHPSLAPQMLWFLLCFFSFLLRPEGPKLAWRAVMQSGKRAAAVSSLCVPSWFLLGRMKHLSWVLDMPAASHALRWDTCSILPSGVVLPPPTEVSHCAAAPSTPSAWMWLGALPLFAGEAAESSAGT